MDASMKKKLWLSLLVGFLFFILLLTRPWYTPTIVNFTQVPEGAVVTVVLEDSWGREVRKTHDPSIQGKRFEFNSARVVGFESDWLGELGVSLQWHLTVVPYSFVKQISIDDPVPQRRWTLVTAAAISLFCSIIVILLFLLLCEWELAKAWSRKSKLGFGVVAISMCVMGAVLTPGLFGWDIVSNYVSAARFENSSFTGRFYSYLFIAGYQLLPALWLVTAANIFITLLSLFHIFSFAQRKNLEKFFYVMLALFILYPANLYMTYFPSRDLAAFWCFVMTLFKMYEIWLEKEEKWLPHAWLVFFATCAICLRQEALPLIGILLLYNIFQQQKHRRWLYSMTLVIPVMCWLPLSFSNRNHSLEYDFYEVTIFVNPLSSILSAKYSKELPPEVDQRLGPFFNNKYFLTHHNPFDIDPFHYGGLDREKATKEGFRQFRSAALGIILENPILFLQNRLVMAQAMLGFNSTRYMHIEDTYFIRPTLDLDKMFHSLPIQKYERWSWADRGLKAWRGFVTSKQEIYFQSYLIPILLWIIWLLFFRGRFFIIVSLVLLARTGLVLLSAPAAYYKYQLPLWMFVPFVLIYLLAEKRQATLLAAE